MAAYDIALGVFTDQPGAVSVSYDNAATWIPYQKGSLVPIWDIPGKGLGFKQNANDDTFLIPMGSLAGGDYPLTIGGFIDGADQALADFAALQAFIGTNFFFDVSTGAGKVLAIGTAVLVDGTVLVAGVTVPAGAEVWLQYGLVNIKVGKGWSTLTYSINNLGALTINAYVTAVNANPALLNTSDNSTINYIVIQP